MNSAATPSAPAARWEPLFRLVPALDSLRNYSLLALRHDLLAGLTVAALAVPQAMAYGLAAGIRPEHGLYAAIVMTAVGALFDSSKQLINGPTNAIAIALLSALAVFPPGERAGAAVVIGLFIGIIQTGITLLRLGDLTRFISHAVIIGFTLGAAVLLAMDQLKNLLGMAGPKDHDHNFLVLFWQTMRDGEIHPLSAAVGIATILFLLSLIAVRRWRGIYLPELLLAMLSMATVTWALGLDDNGVKTVGYIPEGLPSFELPPVESGHLRLLASSALAISLLGLLEAIAMAKAIASRTGQKLDINQQCLSEGLANLAGSFFQCMPGSGSLTRSAVNQQSGAMTQWSGVFAAAAVAAIVMLFAPLARFVPRAALAGILMVTAWRMVDKPQLRYYMTATRFDAIIVLITALSAVMISVEFCILIGTVLSFVLYVPRAARIEMTELRLTPERVVRERQPNDPPCDRVLIVNLEGELFFGSAPELDRHLSEIEQRSRNGVRVVVLRLKRARNPDAVCLAHIGTFLKNMASHKVDVLLCGVRPELGAVLHNCGLEARLESQHTPKKYKETRWMSYGAEAPLESRHIFREEEGVTSSTLEAVRYAYELIGSDMCATCPRREEGNGKEPLYYMI